MQRAVQMAAVAALGAVMVAATLVVGLGRDGGNRSTEALVRLSRPSATPTESRPPAAPRANAAPPPHVDAEKEAAARITVSTSGTLAKDKKRLKVVSARGDLTGQRELRWVADAGRRVGNARCTQNFRLNAQSKASVEPTLLICWRLSPTKSVYTVLVDLDQKPSTKASVVALNKAWASMR